MPNFIIKGIEVIYNSLKDTLWPRRELKRRRESFEEEEESDLFKSVQGVSPQKRARWFISPDVNMDSDEDVQYVPTPDTPQPRITAKYNYNQRFKSTPKTRENDPDIIEIDSDIKEISSQQSIGGQSSANLNGTTPRHPRQPEKASALVNGFGRSNSFTSCLRISAKSTTPKMTAIEQANKVEERANYSRLLNEFMSSNKSGIFNQKPRHQTGEIIEEIDLTGPRPTIKPWKSMDRDLQLVVENGVPSYSSKKKLDCKIGLNSLLDDNQRVRSRGAMLVQMTQTLPRRTQIPVTPWRAPSEPDSGSDTVPAMTSRQPINSMKLKLEKNPLAHLSWIQELTKKYSDMEAEKKRQLEEARLTKEVYGKHNDERRDQLLVKRIQKHLTLTDVVLDDVEEMPVMPKLTKEMNAKIDCALNPNPKIPLSTVLVDDTKLRIRITLEDIKSLKETNWLNDEVINAYMILVNERAKLEGYCDVYAFSTFFYPKLASQGYTADGLGRWTKRAKVDIFTKDMVLVPIHLGVHWCMAQIDFKNQMIRYFDSMGSSNNKCLRALLSYINSEHINKKNEPYDVSKWELVNVKDIPQQMNGFDCGVFSCMFAEFLSRKAKITFSQKDMPYLRRKMVYEIITRKLLQ